MNNNRRSSDVSLNNLFLLVRETPIKESETFVGCGWICVSKYHTKADAEDAFSQYSKTYSHHKYHVISVPVFGYC